MKGKPLDQVLKCKTIYLLLYWYWPSVIGHDWHAQSIRPSPSFHVVSRARLGVARGWPARLVFMGVKYKEYMAPYN